MRYDYQDFLTALGKRIKGLREERGWTHRFLVQNHDFHMTQIYKIESGKGISVPMLMRMAELYEVRLEKLIEDLGIVADAPLESKKPKRQSKVGSKEKKQSKTLKSLT